MADQCFVGRCSRTVHARGLCDLHYRRVMKLGQVPPRTQTAEHPPTSEPSEAEIAWAAGVFEGEGTVVFHKRTSTRRFVVNMTDEDVVRRLCDVLGGTVYGPYVPHKTTLGQKPFWQWSVYTTRDFERVARLIEPWLGERRRDRLRVISSRGKETA